MGIRLEENSRTGMENSDQPARKLKIVEAGENKQSLDVSSDEILIRRAFLSSPEEGCELLFRRYHRALCSHALRYVYSREVAEDIVSDVFCKFWKNASFESVTTSYRFYLFRSVRNEAYTYLRTEFRQGDTQELFFNPEASSGFRPDYITQYEETFHRVKQVVELLPPQCRKVFLMSRFEGKKYKEIAEEMGLSVKTVDTHLVKALKLVRNGLQDYVLMLGGVAVAAFGKGWPF
jgi:RNA polymerase sigma-70 factor (family 1)